MLGYVIPELCRELPGELFLNHGSKDPASEGKEVEQLFHTHTVTVPFCSELIL